MARKLIHRAVVIATALHALCGSSEAADAPPRRAKVVLVDGIELPAQMSDTHMQVRSLLEAATRERGMDLVSAIGPPTCGDTSCFSAIATASGATDVLVVRGGRTASRDYHVELSLWPGTTAEVVPAVVDCSFCTGPQMADAVAKAARPLLDRVVARKVTVASPPPGSVNAPTDAFPPSSSDRVDEHRGRRVVGWSVVGLGAATALGGGIIWSFDGKATDCAGSICKRTYSTIGEGMGLVAAGVVASGVGLWLALDPVRHRDVALTLGTTGAVLAGRF